MHRHATRLLATLLIALATAPPARAEAPPATAAELFVQDKIWPAHLAVDPDAWRAMEPKDTGGGWGKLFNAGAEHTPAKTLAAAVLRKGDADQSASVDAAELRALAGRWFDRWDAARDAPPVTTPPVTAPLATTPPVTGAPHAAPLDAAALSAALDATLDPEGLTRGGTFPIALRAATDGQRNGLATAFGLEFKEVRARLTFAGADVGDVGLRYKGNGTFVESRASLKRSLKIDANAFAKGRTVGGAAKLNFHNNVTDPSRMAESLAYRLYRDAGVPAPRTAYARVHVTVPGLHDRADLGLYSIVENVDARFARHHFADHFADRPNKPRGAIFKPVTVAPFADLGDDWADYRQTYDPKTDVTPAQTRRVIDFARLVTRADDAAFAAQIGDFLDLDQFARFMAVTTYLATLDSLLYVGQNYCLYLHPATDRFQFIPWDVDHAFGGNFGDAKQLAHLSVRRPWVGPNRFLERVFKVEAFERLYTARLTEFAGTLFQPQRLAAQVDALAATLRPAVAAESKQKLEQFDKSVAGGPPPPTGFFAPKPVRSIKRFVDARTPSVLDQLAGKSPGQPGKPMGGFWGRRDGPPGPALAPKLFAAADTDHDRQLTRAELATAFANWLPAWDTDADRALSLKELQAGITKDLAPPPRSHPTTATTRPSP